eukprot:scaffold91789_cov61-Phaeocystis_antarctica.AAC.2
MAIADTAESAVADDEHLASLAMFIKVSALVGDRGFKFEYGGLKVSVFRASKVNSPADKANEGPVQAPARCEARGCRSQAGASVGISPLPGLPVQGAAPTSRC